MRNNNDLNALVGKGFVLDDVVIEYGEVVCRHSCGSFLVRVFHRTEPITSCYCEMSAEWLNTCSLYDSLEEARKVAMALNGDGEYTLLASGDGLSRRINLLEKLITNYNSRENNRLHISLRKMEDDVDLWKRRGLIALVVAMLETMAILVIIGTYI